MFSYRIKYREVRMWLNWFKIGDEKERGKLIRWWGGEGGGGIGVEKDRSSDGEE